MHGGDIYKNKIEYDFSVNLNPLGLNKKIEKSIFNSVKKLVNYPDIKCSLLKKEIANYFCAAFKNTKFDSENIICGNGASELIYGITRALKIKKAMLVSPCFTEYEKAINSVEAKILWYNLSAENDFSLEIKIDNFIENLVLKNPDVLFLTNPNNPNGKLLGTDIIKKISDACKKQNIFLIIDECFIELTESPQEYSFIPFLSEYNNVIILRAFTKSFAIPGLRLGYCVCENKDLILSIENQLPEWNVSVLAQNAGIIALKEKKYLESARKVITEEKKYLVQKLKGLGFDVHGSDSNFILFFSKDFFIKEKLINKNILIRDCCDVKGLSKGYYRIAIKKHDENKILVDALKEVIDE